MPIRSEHARDPAAAREGEVLTFAGRKWRAFDLSQRLSNSTSKNERMPHFIEYRDHAETAAASQNKFGIGAEYWRNGFGWADEQITLTTHSGTHVDAPWHYGATSAGEIAATIDELPFRWFMSDAFVLDVRHIDRHIGVRESDIREELSRINYQIKRYDIALLRTDISERYHEPGYDKLHHGLREDGIRFLVEQGVRLVGIDAWGIDRPFEIMIEEAKHGDRHQLWESHFYGMTRPYSQIEKLSNLKSLPKSHGFQVIALPIRIDRASGAWSRVVALSPED
jgi:kynurenine formamidase